LYGRQISRILEPLCEGWTATRFLGDIGDTRAVDPLILALNDEEWRIRIIASESFGEDTGAVEPLIQVLNDEYDCVRFDTALSP
jgi:HEAT repeat protein